MRFLLVVLLAVACASAPPTREAAPELVGVSTLDGERIDLLQLRGQVVVLDFMSAWCEPCIEALPAQRAMFEHHRDEGLSVVMVSQDENRSDMDVLLERHDIPFPVAMDVDGRWFDAFSLRFVPTLVILDKRGAVAAIFSGYEPEEHDAVLAVVTQLLNEQ